MRPILPIRFATSATIALTIIVTIAGAQDWLAEVRRNVTEKRLEAALAAVDGRLADAPADLEARGWRGRILAWSGRWTEAEAEYRAVLAQHPNDTDILTGLADVLAWQQRYDEALAVLDQARIADASRADVYTRRGRVLRGAGRREEARTEFQQALALAPNDPEARAGLDSVRPEPRHELRIGVDYDVLNYTAEAQTYSVNLRSRWDDRWTTNFGSGFYERFGGKAARLSGSATISVGRAGAFTFGGAGAHDDRVIARGETLLEYDRGFHLSQTGFVRGIELIFTQRHLWFHDGRVLTLGPGAILYLPHDWTWTVQVTAARSRFTGTPAEWRPSGTVRLGFPLRHDLTGNLFFAVGTENFARVDQVGRFSARTWGGGVQWRFAPRQFVSAYALYQDRSQGRTQTSFGFTYGFSF